MDYEFEEDIEPTWFTKQKEDALLTEKAYSENEKRYKWYKFHDKTTRQL